MCVTHNPACIYYMLCRVYIYTVHHPIYIYCALHYVSLSHATYRVLHVTRVFYVLCCVHLLWAMPQVSTMPCDVHTHYIHLSCIMLYVMIHTMLLAHHATGCIHGAYCTRDSILCYPHTLEHLIAQFIKGLCTRDARHLPEVILLLLFSPAEAQKPHPTIRQLTPQAEEVSCFINSHFPRGP